MALPDFLSEGLAVAWHKRNQWKSREALEEIQQERLRSLFMHASGQVPFYKKRFREAGVAGLRSLDDLSSLPVTTKEDVRRNTEAMLSVGQRHDSLHRFSTTGTTGEPLVHFFSRQDAVRGSALRQFSFMECGFAPGDLLMNMAFSRMPRFPMQPLFFRVKSIAPSENPEKDFPALKSSAPDVIFAYPSVLEIMAQANLRLGRQLRIPKAISVSETMRQKTRKIVEDSFGCSIRNYYGASECWAIGWECGEGSLHINSDSVIIEAVDEAGHAVKDGTSGELLITPLWRNAMPFIRYKLADQGILGQGCPCGRGLTVLKSLEGRTSDVIVLPSGRTIPWIFIETPITQTDEFLSYQLIQESRESLHMLVIPGSGALPGIEGRLKAAILARLPENMVVSVEIVADIPRGGRGKRRDFISRLKPSR